MSEAKPRYNRLVNPDVLNEGPFAPAERRTPLVPMNPWLPVMGTLGVLSFIVGMVLYVGGQEPLSVMYVDDSSIVFEEQNTARRAWGGGFVAFGAMLLTAAMAVAAIGWQLRRRDGGGPGASA